MTDNAVIAQPERGLEAATEGAAAPAEDRGARWRRRAAAGVALLLLATVAAGGWWTSQYWRHRQADGTRAAAVAAARQTVLNFVEIDPRALDAGMQRVADSATGDFKTEWLKDRPKLRQAYAANRLQARGEILDAGVVASDRDSVTVLVVVDQTVRKDSSGQPQLRHYRIQTDLVSVRGRWLVSTLSFVS